MSFVDEPMVLVDGDLRAVLQGETHDSEVIPQFRALLTFFGFVVARAVVQSFIFDFPVG